MEPHQRVFCFHSGYSNGYFSRFRTSLLSVRAAYEELLIVRTSLELTNCFQVTMSAEVTHTPTTEVLRTVYFSTLSQVSVKLT